MASGGFSHSDYHTGQYSQYGRGYQGEHGGNIMMYGGPHDGGSRGLGGQGQDRRDRFAMAREMDNHANQYSATYGRHNQDHGEAPPYGRPDDNQWNQGPSEVGYGRGRFNSPNDTIGHQDGHDHPGSYGRGGYGQGSNWNY